MSYEGYEEFLCVNGHHSIVDAFDDDPTCCPQCGARLAYRHSVDETNGVEEGLPDTMPAPTRVVAYEVRTIRVPLHVPVSEWVKIAEESRTIPEGGAGLCPQKADK